MQLAFLQALLSHEPLPSEMQLMLADAFEHLCAGIALPLLVPPQRKGGPARNVVAQRMIDAAIRYLRWCGDGRIVETDPVAKVCVAFGVSTRTVARWSADWSGRSDPPLAESFGPDSVVKLMKANGRAFRRVTGRDEKDPQT